MSSKKKQKAPSPEAEDQEEWPVEPPQPSAHLGSASQPDDSVPDLAGLPSGRAVPPPRTEDSDAEPVIPSASVAKARAPRSPPPVDDVIPPAKVPNVRVPVDASPPPLDAMVDSPSNQRYGGQKSAYAMEVEKELGNVLAAQPPPPPLAPAQGGAVAPTAAMSKAPALPPPAEADSASSALSPDAEAGFAVTFSAAADPSSPGYGSGAEGWDMTNSMDVFADESQGAQALHPEPTKCAEPVKLRPHGLAPKGKETKVQKAFENYSTLMTAWPCPFIVLYIVIFALLIGIAWKDLEIESDFSAFIRADGESARRRDAYVEALEKKKKDQSGRRLHEYFERRLQLRQDPSFDGSYRADSIEHVLQRETDDGPRFRELTANDMQIISEEDVEHAQYLYEMMSPTREGAEPIELLVQEDGEAPNRHRRLQSSLVVLKRSLVLTYLPDDGKAFDARLLKAVRDFEEGIRAMSGWQKLCHTMVNAQHAMLCDPGESFVAYAYPDRDPPSANVSGSRFQLAFTGKGPDLLQIPAALAILQQSDEPRHDLRRFFPKEYAAPAIGTDVDGATQPTGLRTRYIFYLVVGRQGSPLPLLRKNLDSALNTYDAFIKEDLFHAVNDKKVEETRVLFYGDVLTAYEVSRTLMLDVQWAIGSIVFVTLYLWLHSGSFLLSLASMGVIFTAVPLAYVLTPASKTTVASFLSLFLVTGIGCDVVFVFTDCFDQSIEVEKTMQRRIAWTLLHAGRNCLATSLTTAASFFANLFSVLQPLREFGLFMGLSVLSAFLLVSLFLPPLIVIRENCRGDDTKTLPEETATGEMDAMAIVPVVPGAPPAEQPATADGGSAGGGKFGKKPARGKQMMDSLLMYIMDKISARPKTVLLAAAVVLVAFLTGVIVEIELDRAVPDLFPEDHNQVLQAKSLEKFTVLEDVKTINANAEKGPACDVNSQWATLPSTTRNACLLHWCEAPEISFSNASGTSEVTCYVNKVPPQCTQVEWRMRLAASSAPVQNSWWSVVESAVKRLSNWTTVAVTSVPVPGSTGSAELNTLVLENWETGGMQTSRFFAMGSTFVKIVGNATGGTPSDPEGCNIDTICFQGASRCDFSGWRSTGSLTVQFPAARRVLQETEDALAVPEMTPSTMYGEPELRSMHPLHGGRALTSQVPISKRVDITIVWGLRPARHTPLVGPPAEVWRFDPTFELSNPWAQRAIANMCAEAKKQPELLIATQQCWIEEFKSFLVTNSKKRFPTRLLENEVDVWFPRNIRGQEDLWRDGKQVQAAKIAFQLNLANDIAAQPLLDHRAIWDAYVKKMNDQASFTAANAYHTATVWVRAEAEVAIVASTIDTICVAAVCAWLGMAIFTQDPVLAGMVLGLVLGIIVGLAFFITVIAQWAIGSIEVISLVIFVGYSVTYSLHVAHCYGEAPVPGAESHEEEPSGSGGDMEAPLALPGLADQPAQPEQKLSPDELRRFRTRMAIVHIGSAVLSSAVSTLGSSVFLLFTTMVIFKKLGFVFIVVTILSVLCALVLLPALLVLFGPPEKPWITRARQYLSRTLRRIPLRRLKGA